MREVKIKQTKYSDDNIYQESYSIHAMPYFILIMLLKLPQIIISSWCPTSLRHVRLRDLPHNTWCCAYTSPGNIIATKEHIWLLKVIQVMKYKHVKRGYFANVLSIYIEHSQHSDGVLIQGGSI